MKVVQNVLTNYANKRTVLRKADKVARMSKTLFPVVSSSNISARAQGNNLFENLFKKVSYRIGKFVRCYSMQPDSFVRALLIAEAMKRFKVGNCAELSRVANLICKTNGMNTLPFKFSAVKNGVFRDIDHMALLLPAKDFPKDIKGFGQLKEDIIIDPWLGFADYASKAQERYLKDYAKLLKINPNDKLAIDPCSISTMDRLTDKDVIDLKNNIPNYYLDFKI